MGRVCGCIGARFSPCLYMVILFFNMIIIILIYSWAMQTKPSRREATHARIVDVAARALRRDGYAGVGVADVMRQAGLTHGGFYAHFASRDAMLAEAMAHAGAQSAEAIGQRISSGQARGHSTLRALVDAYLSEAHLRGVEGGCVVAALGSEMHRQTPELLAPALERVHNLIHRVQSALPEGGTREQAMVIASTLVGTLQLARTLGANAQGRAMLAAARSALLAQYDHV
jgi:TetR/AcrR family transcriptional regulator, transcriptional repressor for nem operon